jgi:NADPH-dependent curcumin reductase CurA
LKKQTCSDKLIIQEPIMPNHRVLLASRPNGAPTLENFRIEDAPIPTPADGEILLQILYLSLDPYMRGRMNDGPSYAAPVPVGGVMEGGTVAKVIASNNERFAVGDVVLSACGWQTHAISNGKGLRKLDPAAAPVSTALGVLGMPGLTAYVGTLEIGEPKPGETFVVAAAAGPVGATAGQIAKIKGCRVVGIAGGAEKCMYLREELGFDAALDHRAADFPAQLRAACPDGVDIYFENVGGPVLHAVWPLLNNFARVPVCGMIANINLTESPAGPDRSVRMLRDIIIKRLTLRGFIISDHMTQTRDFSRDMGGWIASGRMRYKEDVVAGLDAAPEAFIGLLQGRNFGKLVVKVS